MYFFFLKEKSEVKYGVVYIELKEAVQNKKKWSQNGQEMQRILPQ